MDQIQSITSPLLKVEEAMDVLRIGRTKFYALVKTGQIEVVRFGLRTTRVKASSLERLLTHGIV
ncbi:MAG: helix-turn-helix domain-containing protein [Azonexus sp.]|jgi:excisionase family DNA binding protein|nr:helix-turn-helix domain-containing protein [Azonexus sp.]